MSRYRVTVTKSATRDVREAHAYLLERSASAARHFENETAESLHTLRERAHEFAVWRAPLRRIPLQRFPHGFLYALNSIALRLDQRPTGIWRRDCA